MDAKMREKLGLDRSVPFSTKDLIEGLLLLTRQERYLAFSMIDLLPRDYPVPAALLVALQGAFGGMSYGDLWDAYHTMCWIDDDRELTHFQETLAKLLSRPEG